MKLLLKRVRQAGASSPWTVGLIVVATVFALIAAPPPSASKPAPKTPSRPRVVDPKTASLAGEPEVAQAGTTCDAISNGGFETGSLAPWVVYGTNPTPVVTTDQAHSGTKSVLL